MSARWLRVALFIHVFLFALVTGVFWGTWFSLSRSIGTIPPSTFLDIGHTMIRNLGGPMALLMPATLVSALPVLLGFRRFQQFARFRLATAGVCLLVIALVITLSVNVPIDNAIAGWTVETLPSDWMNVRDRWELFHGLRTFVCLAGFGAALASVVWPAEGHRSGV